MVLDALCSYPHQRCYVIKLHRDAAPAHGRTFGRIEHVVTGDGIEFDSGEALLAWLSIHLEGAAPSPAREDTP